MKITFTILIYFTTLSDQLCFKSAPGYYEHLATKTPYRTVAFKNTARLDVDGCSVKKAWLMVRHGTRDPGKKLTVSVQDVLVPLRTEIIKNFEEGRSSLCPETVDLFRKWHFNISSSDKHLTLVGEEELLEMGERFQIRFPEVFPDVFSSKYQFRSTGTQRADESMRNFMIGLFDRKTVESIWPLEKDPSDYKVLRFYKLCKRWKEEVDKNPDSLIEKNKVENSKEWFEMVSNVSARLGLEKHIKKKTLTAIYTLCAFETAWQTESPWCGVFSKRELTLLELSEDLEYYFIDGYGYAINYKQACVAVKDLIKHFTNENGPTTSVSFSHSGTILKLLARFSLYNDSEWLTTYAPNRLWRTGRIDAFGSNLAFILYRCGLEDKFLFLHQERPIPFPGCPEEGLCPFRIFLDQHKDKCNFEEMCAVKPSITVI